MKRRIVLLFLILIMKSSFCQRLEGEWEGNFETNAVNFNTFATNTKSKSIRIKLKFTLKSDSTYNIYSYTEGLYFNQREPVVCSMTGYIREDSIFLREVSNISPSYTSNIGFQTMYLKLKRKKKGFELSGKWEDNESGKGRIYFYKRDEK